MDGRRFFACGGAEVCWPGVGAREGCDREGSPGGVAGGNCRISAYPGQVRGRGGALVFGFDTPGPPLFFLSFILPVGVQCGALLGDVVQGALLAHIKHSGDGVFEVSAPPLL